MVDPKKTDLSCGSHLMYYDGPVPGTCTGNGMSTVLIPVLVLLVQSLVLVPGTVTR